MGSAASTNHTTHHLPHLTAHDVGKLVSGLGSNFKAYESLIVDNALCGQVLSAMTDRELHQAYDVLGISNPVHRKVLSTHWQRLTAASGGVPPPIVPPEEKDHENSTSACGIRQRLSISSTHSNPSSSLKPLQRVSSLLQVIQPTPTKSNYNTEYYCIIKAVRFEEDKPIPISGESCGSNSDFEEKESEFFRVVIQYEAYGDPSLSLGALQPPNDSMLLCERNRYAPESVLIDHQNATESRGEIVYLIPRGSNEAQTLCDGEGDVYFVYGSHGYQAVKLAMPKILPPFASTIPSLVDGVCEGPRDNSGKDQIPIPVVAGIVDTHHKKRHDSFEDLPLTAESLSLVDASYMAAHSRNRSSHDPPIMFSEPFVLLPHCSVNHSHGKHTDSLKHIMIISDSKQGSYCHGYKCQTCKRSIKLRSHRRQSSDKRMIGIMREDSKGVELTTTGTIDLKSESKDVTDDMPNNNTITLDGKEYGYFRWICFQCQTDRCFYCEPPRSFVPHCRAHITPAANTASTADATAAVSNSTDTLVEHQMVKCSGIDRYGARACDHCGREHLQYDPEFYHCLQDDYDLCWQCACEQVREQQIALYTESVVVGSEGKDDDVLSPLSSSPLPHRHPSGHK